MNVLTPIIQRIHILNGFSFNKHYDSSKVSKAGIHISCSKPFRFEKTTGTEKINVCGVPQKNRDSQSYKYKRTEENHS